MAEAERHRRRGPAAGSVAAPPSEQETVRTLTCWRAVQLACALEPWSTRKSVCGCTRKALARSCPRGPRMLFVTE